MVKRRYSKYAGKVVPQWRVKRNGERYWAGTSAGTYASITDARREAKKTIRRVKHIVGYRLVRRK